MPATLIICTHIRQQLIVVNFINHLQTKRHTVIIQEHFKVLLICLFLFNIFLSQNFQLMNMS